MTLQPRERRSAIGVFITIVKMRGAVDSPKGSTL